MAETAPASTKPTANSVEFKVGADNDKEWDETAAKGAPDGLFRSCMKAIKTSHKKALSIRTVLIAAGLFTDKIIYRQAIALFYTVTKELELKLKSREFRQQLKDDKVELEMLDKITAYAEQYYFADAYEKDLRQLFTPETWEKEVDRIVYDRPEAVFFLHHILAMKTASDLAAAIFCLWGALIIGGGAAARRRAKALYGDHVLELFVKISGPGREQRKVGFIKFFDSLAEPGSSSFGEICYKTELCMEKSNRMLRSISANPWWLKWMGLVAVSVPAVVLALWYGPSSGRSADTM